MDVWLSWIDYLMLLATKHVRYLLNLRYKKIVYCGRVAQLDRVPGYEPGGRRFDSCRVRHFSFSG